MTGRYLSPKAIAAAKREMEIFNSMLKRGEIREPENILREHYIVCGCGAEGCGFIFCTRKEKENETI